MKANTEGQLPKNLYELFSDRRLHTVTFTSLAMQQLDQVRRAAFNLLEKPDPLPRVQIRYVYHHYSCCLTRALWQFLKVCGS